MVVGVNGVGKTTTIGKLAAQFKRAGLKVMLGAADTFRAAAVEQLDIWGQRAGVPVIKQQLGSDSAAVAFDTVSAAVAQGMDVVIIDTAGRLHNAFEQAKQFVAATKVNQLAITKLDGTAKGGVVIGISDQFKIPIKYIGLGEGIDDLQVFRKDEFVKSLFGQE